MLHTRSVRWRSPVISSTLVRRRRWLTVSYAADRSTKTVPVICSLSKPSSMCSCSVVVLLCLSWNFVKFSYRCLSLLATVCHVRRFKVCHALWRSSEIVFISSSPASMVASAKGSDYNYVCIVHIFQSTRVLDQGRSFSYIREGCSSLQPFVRHLRTGCISLF